MEITTKTLRDAARQLVIAAVIEAATKQHERNYEKLHVFRDGRVSWFESINTSDDLIDGEADYFAPIKSVITVGTGSGNCNCAYCNSVYNAEEEARAAEAGREYKRCDKYDTLAEAITEAVGNSDLSYLEEEMLDRFDAIPAGYFDDEVAMARIA